jgi:hypothetical protein
MLPSTAVYSTSTFERKSFGDGAILAPKGRLFALGVPNVLGVRLGDLFAAAWLNRDTEAVAMSQSD